MGAVYVSRQSIIHSTVKFEKAIFGQCSSFKKDFLGINEIYGKTFKIYSNGKTT